MGQNREGKYITQFIDQDETSLLEGARANLEQLDYVGFADSFDHDIREIFQDLGADNIDVPLANTSASHLLDMDGILIFSICTPWAQHLTCKTL